MVHNILFLAGASQMLEEAHKQGINAIALPSILSPVTGINTEFGASITLWV